MNAKQSFQANSQQLLQQITRRIEELAQATDTARMSEEMLRYLDTVAQFHRYSLFNTCLIMMACPHATVVAGFHAWRKLSRFVRRGEHGIPILAPMLITEKEKDGSEHKSLLGFKVVYVYDLSQTDGEPLPEPPDWKSPEKNALLAERLIAFAAEHGIAVAEKMLPGDTQGLSKGGVVEVAPNAGTSTLIHEIAHELMHKAVNAPVERGIRELEAEAVAYVVAKHFGLRGMGSPVYIALHGAKSEMFMAHIERVRTASAEIIEFLESSAPSVVEQCSNFDQPHDFLM